MSNRTSKLDRLVNLLFLRFVFRQRSGDFQQRNTRTSIAFKQACQSNRIQEFGISVENFDDRLDRCQNFVNRVEDRLNKILQKCPQVHSDIVEVDRETRISRLFLIAVVEQREVDCELK